MIGDYIKLTLYFHGSVKYNAGTQSARIKSDDGKIDITLDAYKDHTSGSMCFKDEYNKFDITAMLDSPEDEDDETSI